MADTSSHKAKPTVRSLVRKGQKFTERQIKGRIRQLEHRIPAMESQLEALLQGLKGAKRELKHMKDSLGIE